MGYGDTPEEWGKIKRPVAERGKGYKISKEARDYLKSGLF